jgi:polysaccharide export outer membrane protein
MVLVLLALLLAAQAPTAAPDRAPVIYALGAADVVVVNVLGQASMSGRYQIGADGSFEFPLIGRVEARGKDTDGLARELTDRLAEGYLRRPQVSVSVAEYVSQRVYVIGEVRVPGAVSVTGQVTLLGAISKAGGLTETAGGDFVLVRPSEGAHAPGPTLPNEPRATIVLKANTRDLRIGTLARNDVLNPGDTVFVPRAQTFQVLGQVRSPGSFTYEPGLTVLRALSSAGGATELGAVNRARIIRATDASQKEVSVKLNALVEPGDTIVIPTKRW